MQIEHSKDSRRSKLKQDLTKQFADYFLIKENLSHPKQSKPFKDLLNEVHLNKNRKKQEVVKKHVYIKNIILRSGKSIQHSRIHRSLGQQRDIETVNYIMNKAVDDDLESEYNNLRKRNLELSLKIKDVSEQIRKSIKIEQLQSLKLNKIQNKRALLQFRCYHSRQISKQKTMSLRNQKIKQKYSRVHTELENTQQMHVDLLSDINNRQEYNKNLKQQLKQLKNKQSQMKQKIEAVQKTSQKIYNYYQIENYVDSILNQYHKYIIMSDKRSSKLVSATDKIISFFNDQFHKQEDLMNKYQQLILQKQQLCNQLEFEVPFIDPQWVNSLINSSEGVLDKIYYKLNRSIHRLFNYYDRIPYKPYQPESIMTFKKSNFKQLQEREISSETLSDLFIFHPFILKMFNQMPIFKKYSSVQFIKSLLSRKCDKKQYEYRTQQLLLELCGDAVNRYTTVITSFIQIIQSIAVQFKKVRAKIHKYKSTKIIQQTRSYTPSAYSKTHTRLSKMTSNIGNGFRKPLKKNTIALFLEKEKSISLSEQLND